MAVVAVLVTDVAFLVVFALVCWYVLQILFRTVRVTCPQLLGHRSRSLTLTSRSV